MANTPTFTDAPVSAASSVDFHATLSRWLVNSTPSIVITLLILYGINTAESRSTTSVFLAGVAIALLLLSISVFKSISTSLSITQTEIIYKVFAKKIVISRSDVSTIYARSKFAQNFFVRLKNDRMIKIPLTLFSTTDCVALFETLNVPDDQRPAYSVRGWRGHRLMR